MEQEQPNDKELAHITIKCASRLGKRWRVDPRELYYGAYVRVHRARELNADPAYYGRIGCLGIIDIKRIEDRYRSHYIVDTVKPLILKSIMAKQENNGTILGAWIDLAKYREHINIRFRLFAYLVYVEHWTHRELCEYFGLKQARVSQILIDFRKEFCESLIRSNKVKNAYSETVERNVS